MANKFFGPFLWVVTGCGSLAFLYSSVRSTSPSSIPASRYWSAMALLLTSRITIPIPRLSSQISVSDTFVFLVLLLYGSAAAVVVGAVEAFLSSLRFSRKPRIVAFNWASAAVSIFITSSVLELIFGSVVALREKPITATLSPQSARWRSRITSSNSGIVAIGAALKTTNQSGKRGASIIFGLRSLISPAHVPQE